MWLQEAEWKSLVPAKPSKGASFPMPDKVRDRICHWHIAGGYHCLPGYYTKDSFQAKELTLEVEGVTPQEVTLRLRGYATMKSLAAYRFHGVFKYDIQKKVFSRFDLVAGQSHH